MVHAQDMIFCKRKLTTFLKINILLVGCLYILLIRHVTQQIGPGFSNIVRNVINISESKNLGIKATQNGTFLRNLTASLEVPPRDISGANKNGITLEKYISNNVVFMNETKNNTTTSTTQIVTSTTTTTTTTVTSSSSSTTTTTTTIATTTSAHVNATTKKPAPVVKKVISEAEFYSRKTEKIHPFAHSLLIEGKQICSNDTYMMILIHSFHPYASRRQAIRATWGSVAKGGEWPLRNINVKISLAFTFGVHAQDIHNTNIKKESDQYGDIIQGDFREDYKNMTLKSLLEFHWMTKYCPSAKYLLKSDDDMFINIPYLIKVLQNDTMPPKSIMGPYNRRSKVYRNSKKWGVSKTVYPFDYYPPYESGAAYIITGDLMKDFFDTAEYVPQFHIDDVYITGILAKMLNVTHVLKYGFAYANTKRAKPCELNGEVVITSTKMTPEIMKSTWKEIATCPTLPALPVNTTQSIPPAKKT